MDGVDGINGVDGVDGVNAGEIRFYNADGSTLLASIGDATVSTASINIPAGQDGINGVDGLNCPEI
eukprot:403151-Hanusia_phi.AAC.1